MENKLIEVLIRHYKEQGLSLDRILDDPLFKQLPLTERVKILQAKAAYLRENSVHDKYDFGNLAATTGLGATAIGTGVFAYKKMAPIMAEAMQSGTFNPTMLEGTGIGAAVSLGGLALMHFINKSQKLKKRQEALNMIRNSDLSTQSGALAALHQRARD